MINNNISACYFQFGYELQSAIFYIQDEQVAQAVRRCSRRITMPNGFNVRLHFMFYSSMCVYILCFIPQCAFTFYVLSRKF